MIPRDSTRLQLLQLIRCDDAGIIIHYLFIYLFTTPEGFRFGTAGPNSRVVKRQTAHSTLYAARTLPRF